MAVPYRLRLGAGALALGFLVVGCSEPEQQPPTPVPTLAQPTSPSPSSTPTMSESEAVAVARARGYVVMVDKLRSNPEANLDQLSTVARGQAADNWRQILLNDRSVGHRQTGDTQLNIIGTKAGSSVQQWVVTMCLDVSDVDIVDRSGKSVVSKSRPDRIRDVLIVDQDASSSKWYVTQDKVTETC